MHQRPPYFFEAEQNIKEPVASLASPSSLQIVLSSYT